MEECLITKKSNCKNCYKCIRYCPVKSIKFTDNQAHIMRDECVLCGECYVVCPQDAKQIRNDVSYAKKLINSGNEVYVSLAPSFVALYENKSIKDMSVAIKKLGFKDAFETAIGATIVKKQYEELIAKKKNKVIISSCCHTINTLIQKHYTNAIEYLAEVVTPMYAHAFDIKQKHPNSKVVFIGPCISKKDEAHKYPNVVDCVLTFDELDEWFEKENIVVESKFQDEQRGRARLFPTSGGIFGCMDRSADYSYIAVDGMENCINTLKDIEKNNIQNCFIEMSACSGSCIGGPIMRRKARNPVKDKVQIQKSITSADFDVREYEEDETKRTFSFEGISKMMPGSSAVEEILKKMGKASKEQELNCGSCGYNTCREKAVAVFMGKADLSMCLPYLKEKAESFSDKIINNTPNGIIVLNENLEIQQMNSSAMKILNLPLSMDILGSPVVRILDPVDYVLSLSDEKNIYDNKKYLAQYQKYIEETVIYDKEYHILMLLMKDITKEEHIRSKKDDQNKTAIEITDKVVEKQMRVVQEIASLLGETTAETKIALTKLKETLSDE